MYSEALISGDGFGLGEALSTGLSVTGVGISIVFGVLLILMIVLCLFKVIFYKDPAKTVKKTVQETPAPAAPTPAAAPKDEMNEEELIAVLTAAVAASLNTSTYKLQIKSYRRIDNSKPAWNKAGVRDTINSRF